MKKTILLLSLFLTSGCFATAMDLSKTVAPDQWTKTDTEIIEKENVQSLKKWWEKFDDPNLNTLVTEMLNNSPDREIAQSRILEARGLRRSTRSLLFPQVNASGSAGREDTGNDEDNFYEARFDASYEVDLFGKNRKATDAANKNIEAFEAQYHDVTLTLIAEVVREYIAFRQYKEQQVIAQKNIEIQIKTLELIQNQKKFGEAPQLDVERAENVVNTTKASIPEFKRLADAAQYRLTVLTALLPEQMKKLLEEDQTIVESDICPLLMAPADLLSLRPDIRAAQLTLQASTSLAEAATADLFPQITISGFFGQIDNALLNSTSIWNVALGAAVSVLDFGRIEGQIDAARAVEKRAYEAYRKTILEAVSEVETALSNYVNVRDQQIYLAKAYENAEKALELSQILYKEGEVAFINVLEAQRTANEAESALVDAKAAQIQSVASLYKSIGIY